MGMQKRTPTIGLLVSGITDIFTESVCKGVRHAASKAGMNLVVLPGRYLDRDLTQMREIMYEYQYNTIFTYANKDNLDAVIVSAGSIGCFTTKERGTAARLKRRLQWQTKNYTKQKRTE